MNHGDPPPGRLDQKEAAAPMAVKKSETDQRVVQLDIPIEHRMILRNKIETWRDGDRGDLEKPATLARPEAARRRVATYARLIEALRVGRIALPDEEARARLTEAAEGFDQEQAWEEKKVEHDCLWSFLDYLGGRVDIDAGTSTMAKDDLVLESVLFRRVIDAHRTHLGEAELVLELGDARADSGGDDAVNRAVHDLTVAGLLHIRDGLITPARAALRSQEPQDL